jgi:rubrerythrin
MAQAETRSDAQVVAMLNDLLQLDHDAVQAYSLAIGSLENSEYAETLKRFRADHERHIQDLTELINAHGGTAIQLAHVPTGAFKLALQAVGSMGSDREVLLAFKANERQVRDKYGRMAEGSNPPDVAEVLHRNAADEQKHYAWASTTLERLGAGSTTTAGRAERAFESAHSRTADAVEGVERKGMEQVEGMRRSRLPRIGLGLGIGAAAAIGAWRLLSNR